MTTVDLAKHIRKTVKPGTGGVDILLVDDEPEALDELSSVLSLRGIRSERAETVGSALKILTENKQLSIVITDLRMPGQSGN